MNEEEDYIQKRTVKGFVWWLWGTISWKLTGGCGIQMYLHREGIARTVGGWLVEQYGFARNQYWPSRHEMEFDKKRRQEVEK